jgi:HlyD family secretion protein
MTRKKIILIAAAVVVVGAVVALNAARSSKKGATVQTEKVRSGNLQQMVSATGRVVPPTEVKVSANISGRITKIHVEEGDAVKRGELLVDLERDRYEYSVSKARSALSEAEAKLVQAELEFERQKGLHERNLISKAEYDGAEASFKASKYSVEQMRASLAEGEEYLRDCTIYSPIDGIVTTLTAKQGENVVIGTMNNPGTVIMVISDLSVIEIESEVDETDVSLVRIDQPVKVELDAFPDSSFVGKVARIGNSAKVSNFGSQDQATNFMVYVRLTEPVTNIKPGMTSTVEITTNTRSDVLQIPIQAVVLRDRTDSTKQAAGADTDAGVAVAATADSSAKGGDAGKPKELEGVYVVEGGKARFREIKTGIADQQNIEVATGLSKDEEIITGSFKVLRELKDGDPVKVDNAQLAKLGKQGA